MPERIQLRRTKGWRLPANTIVVARPSNWGNPFIVVRDADAWHVACDDGQRHSGVYLSCTDARRRAVSLFRDYARERATREPEWLKALRGKNLACWCAESPCHADVLLELANTQEIE
jgi:hypothetical protein